MSSDQCWQCGKDYSHDELLDIPVFRKFTVVWCLNCVKKQLRYTDYKLVKKNQSGAEKPISNNVAVSNEKKYGSEKPDRKLYICPTCKGKPKELNDFPMASGIGWYCPKCGVDLLVEYKKPDRKKKVKK